MESPFYGIAFTNLLAWFLKPLLFQVAKPPPSKIRVAQNLEKLPCSCKDCKCDSNLHDPQPSCLVHPQKRSPSSSLSESSCSSSSPSLPCKKRMRRLHSKISISDLNLLHNQIEQLKMECRSLHARLNALESSSLEKVSEIQPEAPFTADLSSGEEKYSLAKESLENESHHSSCYFPPSSTPSLSHLKDDSREDRDFYLFPQDTTFTNEGVEYNSVVIPYDSGALEFAKIQGQEAFTPVCITPAVSLLLDHSECLGHVTKPAPGSCSKFSSISKICNARAYRSLNLQPGSQTSHTIFSLCPDTFIAMIPTTESLALPTPFRKTPMYLELSPDCDSPLEIYSFANAPILGQDCHKLKGLLAGYTSEVPDFLRTQDFNARQTLANLLFCFATVHALLGIKELIAVAPRHIEDHLRAIHTITTHGTLESLVVAIHNSATTARRIRAEMRNKATSRIKMDRVRTSLRGGSLFSASLFHEDAVRKAEDCC